MSFQPNAMNYTQGFGSSPENVIWPHIDVRAPATSDILYPIGKRWVNTILGTEYTLTSLSSFNGSTTANWTLLGAASGDLSTLTSDGPTVVTPTSGNITLNGTANQITTTGSNSPGKVVLSVPSTFIAPGSIAATTTLTATLGAITATNGNLVLGSAGNKLVIHATTAASDSIGTTVAMSGTPGSLIVATSSVKTASKIFIQRNTVGGTLGNISCPSASIIDSTSFVINSDANETSTFNYWIVN